jgi:cephalosporin-C deacetylase-like acetyl esterase
MVSLVALLVLAQVAPAAPQVQISPDQKSGIYEAGQKVTWNIQVTDGTTPLDGKITYTVLQGGLKEIASGNADLKEGKTTVIASRENAGTLLLKVVYKPENAKEITGLGGAVYSPDQIKASMAAPEDFDQFWKDKIADLDKVPMNVKLEPVDVGDKSIEYFKVTFDNIQGKKIHGQLAKPAGKQNLPALLQVQWAGVYPLNRDWVLGHARSGWMALNILAHDLPIDETADFYAEKAKKELNDYPGIGNDSRDTTYFLPMFLSCRRAVDYLAQHPDWNKKALVVQGGSQGGYQALVTGGIHPAVTGVLANVPAGCDHTGKSAGRAPGWPNWASRTWQGKDEKKMLDAARYFDAMNFAARIKCPTLVGVGLVDTVCPAEGVLATCNQIPGTKKIVIMPRADHGGDHKAYYEAFGPFLEKLKQGTE